MNTNILLFSVLIFLGAASAYYVYLNYKPAATVNNTIIVNIKGNKFTLEIADSPRLRQKGLMNRENLPQNQGMLFVFPNTSIHPFWMKDTLIPLDIIWLNKDKEIVYIKESAQPCSNVVEAVCRTIIPKKPARYVVELNGGEVEKLHLRRGDSVDFEVLR